MYNLACQIFGVIRIKVVTSLKTLCFLGFVCFLLVEESGGFS